MYNITMGDQAQSISLLQDSICRKCSQKGVYKQDYWFFGAEEDVDAFEG